MHSLALLLHGFVALSDASPAPPAPSPVRRILVLDLAGRGVDADMTRTLSDIVAAAVARDRGYAVTSGEDVRALLAVEGARSISGCDENASCLADLAGALDAELVVTGSVGSLGDLLVVSVAFYDARTQTALGREKVEARDLADLSPRLEAAVGRLLGTRLASPPSPPSPMLLGGLILGGISLWSLGVQSDPASAGADKATAASLLAPSLVAGAVGLAAVVGGGALALLAGTNREEP